MKQINFIDLGTCGYQRALDIQHYILDKVQKRELKSTLLFVEHPHVLTMGRRAKDNNIYLDKEELQRKGIDIFYINRGGDVTYHGFGQLVGYPIFDLEVFGKDIKKFVLNIETSIINNLYSNHNVSAGVNEGVYTGVWTGDKKICAIGIGVKKWVSYHGFAYNINTELSCFDYINPCGLGQNSVTSLQSIKGREIDFESEKKLVLESLCDVFEVSYIEKKIKEAGDGFDVE